MEIGIYLPNQQISDVDLTNPQEGNPGIGGTEFLMTCLPFYINKHGPGTVNWTIFANETSRLPKSTKSIVSDNILDALRQAENMGMDSLIWRPTNSDESKKFITKMDSYGVDIIAWAHNTPPVNILHKLHSCDQLKRFVCVGREQLDELRDCKIFNKATYIYNGFYMNDFEPVDLTNKPETVVTYVGSLVPDKGFHVLAEIWPSIVERVPEAELKVIGSGKLYNREKELGEWGIAAEEYEQQFRPHLSDRNGNVHDSVTFEGLVSNEKKIEIMQNSRVGVINPTGRTENCPGSAIEFQAAGTPVVSAAKRGLFDTVIHEKTGLLGDNSEEIRDYIVMLLQNEQRARDFGAAGIEFIRQRFSYEKVSSEWIELFNRVSKNQPPKQEEIKQNYFKNWKWLREWMRILKRYVPPVRYVPCLKEAGEKYYQ